MTKEEARTRMYCVDTLSGAIGLALIFARAVDDLPLRQSLERVDALLFHEAANFLKLPYRPRRRKRKP